MKLKKYIAPDMRQALRQVREEQGPDAVIVANRSVREGVEITVAIDYDEATESAVASSAAAPSVATPAAGGLRGFRDLIERQSETQGRAEPPADGRVNEELRTLRRMLETQLAALAWNDLTRRAPFATELLRELTEIGFTRDVAARVADALPPGVDFPAARRLAIARLADQLLTTGDRWTEFGGVIALVGPPGSGKSSALAKLAARWTMRHGSADLVLIGMDTERLGAAEELTQLGRLLGARAYLCDSMEQLPSLLQHAQRGRLVLIDTAGVGARDPRLAQQAEALLAAHADLELAVTLSACMQAGALEQVVDSLRGQSRRSCVFTHVDECASLGGALSAMIRSRLPVAYVCEGRRIPDDLRVARALDLVSTAVLLAEKLGAAADEDMLTRRFHGVANGRP
jgi:flagellar biosynthesis protein FlhF